MKYLIHILLLNLILLTGCADEVDIQHEMRAFDKAFVPVWHFAHTGDIKNAESHALYLETKWYDLKNNYEDVIGVEMVWEDTYKCIDELITNALHNIEYQDLASAEYDLEGVRFELMELRTRYGIDYSLDYLWEFQMTYDLVQELTHQEYYYREWYEFDCLLDELNYTWNDLLKADHNPFWNSSQERAWHTYQTQISVLLIHYNSSMQRNTIDTELVNSNIDAIEPILFKMFQLFGDFEKAEQLTMAKL